MYEAFSRNVDCTRKRHTTCVRSSFQSIFIDVEQMKNGCFPSTKLIVGSLLQRSLFFGWFFFLHYYLVFALYVVSAHSFNRLGMSLMVFIRFAPALIFFPGTSHRILFRCESRAKQCETQGQNIAMYYMNRFSHFQPEVIAHIHYKWW